MSISKKIINCIATTCLVTATTTYAGSLTINNNTDFDSTSKINDGLCSTVFGSDGVTKAHSTHIISDKLISLACVLNSSNCKATIFMTNDCSGPIIANIILDTKTGIKNIDVLSSQFKFTAGTNEVSVDQLV